MQFDATTHFSPLVPNEQDFKYYAREKLFHLRVFLSHGGRSQKGRYSEIENWRIARFKIKFSPNIRTRIYFILSDKPFRQSFQCMHEYDCMTRRGHTVDYCQAAGRGAANTFMLLCDMETTSIIRHGSLRVSNNADGCTCIDFNTLGSEVNVCLKCHY